METKLKKIPTEKPDFEIYCVLDVCLPDKLIDKIIVTNKNYFNMFTSCRYGIGVACIKLQVVDNRILMRTFDRYGNEAATYKMLRNYSLKLYKDYVPEGFYFTKDGHNLSLYEYEDEDGNPMFQVLDDEGLDPIGDAFTLNEGIHTVNTYWDNHIGLAFSWDDRKTRMKQTAENGLLILD